MNTLRFTRTLVALVALTAAIAAFAVPSWAGSDTVDGYVTIFNGTNHDAWVDVSWAYKTTTWHIDKAFCITKGNSMIHMINYNTPYLGAQMRVRAEIKNGDCRANNITVLQWKEDLPYIGGKIVMYHVYLKGNGPYTLEGVKNSK